MEIILISPPKFSLVGPEDLDESGEKMVIVESFESVGMECPTLFVGQICLPRLGEKASEERRPSNLLLVLKQGLVSARRMTRYYVVGAYKPVGNRSEQGHSKSRWNTSMRTVVGESLDQVRSEEIAMLVVTSKKMMECFRMYRAMSANDGKPRLPPAFLVCGAGREFVIHKFGEVVLLLSTVGTY